MLCNLTSSKDDASGKWRQQCADCKFTKLTIGERYRYSCAIANPLPLGDWLAAGLNWIGFTEQRYAAIRGRKRVTGGMNCQWSNADEMDCGCPGRRGAMNRAGRWVYFHVLRRRINRQK